jgi:hypothetical protein
MERFEYCYGVTLLRKSFPLTIRLAYQVVLVHLSDLGRDNTNWTLLYAANACRENRTGSC